MQVNYVKKILLLFFGLMLLVLPASAHEGADTEEIADFQTHIAISAENIATITETITYDFAHLERHGIRRFVPVKTSAAGTGKFYYYEFKFLSAQMDGEAVPIEVSRDGNFMVMRLGDANATISGIHTYRLRYQMWPVIEADADAGFLNWNLTGNYWDVPIAAATATISMPVGSQISDARCYGGATGTNTQNCTVDIKAETIEVTASSALAPGDGITINARVGAGSVNNYLQASSRKPAEWLPFVGIAVGALMLVIGLLARMMAWLRHRLRLADATIVPQFGPPKGLTPGEIGLLNDNRADMTEITATLIDLAVKGYLRIEQTKPKSLFKKAEYKFYLLKSYASAKNFEKELLDLLFKGSKKSVSLSSVSASAAASAIAKVKKHLKEHMKRQGYYELPAKGSAARKRILKIFGLLILVIFGLNIYSWIQTNNGALPIWSTFIAASSAIGGLLLAKRTELTTAGYGRWADIAGLKMYLTVAERDRLKFHNAPSKKPRHFNELLPYAIALGVEKQWANQFKNMDVAKEAGWYSGHYGNTFFAHSFASAVGSDFSSAISSSFTPSQSSGGYSGGGSSGGGGGGGGGGSW